MLRSGGGGEAPATNTPCGTPVIFSTLRETPATSTSRSRTPVATNNPLCDTPTLSSRQSCVSPEVVLEFLCLEEGTDYGYLSDHDRQILRDIQYPLQSSLCYQDDQESWISTDIEPADIEFGCASEVFNCIASGQFNPNDLESLLPSLCSTPSLFTFQAAEEPLNNLQAIEEHFIDDIHENDVDDTIRSKEQLSYKMKEDNTVINDGENVENIQQFSNDKIIEENYSRDQNIQKCDDFLQTSKLQPKVNDQTETSNLPGYERNSENSNDLTVCQPNSIPDSVNYTSTKLSEAVQPIQTNSSIPTSPVVNFGSNDFPKNQEYSSTLQSPGLSNPVNTMSDTMQHIHINHFTANLTYLPAASGGMTSFNIPPPALPTQIQVTSSGGLALRQPLPFATYPLNYVAPFPQAEAGLQPKHSVDHAFPPPLVIYPTSNNNGGPALHFSMYTSSNEPYNPSTTIGGDNNEKIIKMDSGPTKVAAVINSDISVTKPENDESRKANQDETQIKPKLAVNEDQELAGLYESRNRNAPGRSSVPATMPIMSKVSSPLQYVVDERRVCHRPTPPPFPLKDQKEVGTNNSSPTTEGKASKQAEVNHDYNVNNAAEDDTEKQTANSKSWASFLFSGTEQCFERVSVEKPTARIPPFSTTPPEAEEGSNNNVQQQHRIKIGKFLKNYQLNHAPAALMPRGLTNRSNWCFVNAVLQALLACPTLYNLLKNLSYEMVNNIGHNNSNSTTPKLDAMVDLANEFRPLKIFGRHPLQKKDRLSSRQEILSDTAVEPNNVYNVLLKSRQWREESVNGDGKCSSVGGEGRQQDAEEFLSHLLNGLDEEMRSLIMLGNSSQMNERQNDDSATTSGELEEVNRKGCITRRIVDQTTTTRTPIQALFSGITRSSVIAENCETSAMLQPFFALQLDIPATQHMPSSQSFDLLDVIAHNFAPEVLEGYRNPRTGQLATTASKTLSLEELPLVMIFHLKRMVYDGYSEQKVMTEINFPVDIVIPRDILSANCKTKYTLKQKQYKLFAVVYHKGTEASNGHYITDIYHTGIVMSKLLAGSKQPQNNSSSSDQQGVDYDFSRLPISFKTSLDESSNSKGDPASSAVVISRKRKAWEGTGRTVSNKYVGSGRLPNNRDPDDEDDKGDDHDGIIIAKGDGLDTPVCSRTGFEDEVQDGRAGTDEDGGHSGESGGNSGSGDGHHHLHNNHHHHHHNHGHHGKTNGNNLLSPMNPNLLNVDDIDTDNLAADFDGSFTGLGVDITTAHYSMSDAMISLNNIVINSSQIKQESSGRYASPKSDPSYMFSSYGALDLSNDEAQHAASHEIGETSPPNQTGPQTFSGSVSRDNSMDKVLTGVKCKSTQQVENLIASKLLNADTKESKMDILGKNLSDNLSSELLHQSLASGLYGPSKIELVTGSSNSGGGGVGIQPFEDSDSSFQYVLTAPTSIATKVGEPSLTYINQGQSYELKMKKLGDLSSHYKKKWLRSHVRICFHERRLQYIESEQIAEWARSHPNERILEIDMPLSYGIGDVRQEYDQLNQVSFSWDPTRETGVFIKVHCISTEFTPKKHGGERGVPFKLQIETYSNEARVHAAACILQVFKLKGADRKHKQDREKVQKRTPMEQEKYSQQYECTVLTDLSVDSIYIPPSRGISPIQSDNESLNSVAKATVKASSLPPSTAANRVDDSSAIPTSVARVGVGVVPVNWVAPSQPLSETKTWKRVLPGNATPDTVATWLAYHRYNEHLKTFQNCDAQDLLRFAKSELVQIVGPIDGIRLYNDLHLTPVSPRLVLYIAQKDDSIFNPILLREVTTLELGKTLASTFKILEKYTMKIIASGPNKIPVRMTDEYLRYQDAESAYLVTFLYDETMGMCTAHLEGVTFHQVQQQQT